MGRGNGPLFLFATCKSAGAMQGPIIHSPFPGIKNIKGSGMARPKKSLGYVRIQIHLELLENLGWLFFNPAFKIGDLEELNGPPIQRVLMKSMSAASAFPCHSGSPCTYPAPLQWHGIASIWQLRLTVVFFDCNWCGQACEVSCL